MLRFPTGWSTGHIPSEGPPEDAPGPHSLTAPGRVDYNDYCLESITFIYSKGVLPLNPTEVAQLVVEVASEKLAADIVMLDLRRLASFADYFVVMTAESSRQIEALEDDISKAMREAGVNRYHREGARGSGWVLLDYSDVIVHIFGPDEREYFGLERLWSQAPQVVRVQ